MNLQNEIAERRVALSAILISLLEQQKNRRDQLLETINHIEQKRSSSVITCFIFILFRYQFDLFYFSLILYLF